MRKSTMTITTRLGAIAVLLAGSASSFADLSSMPSGTYGLDKNHAYITITYSHLWDKPRCEYVIVM